MIFLLFLSFLLSLVFVCSFVPSFVSVCLPACSLSACLSVYLFVLVQTFLPTLQALRVMKAEALKEAVSITEADLLK